MTTKFFRCAVALLFAAFVFGACEKVAPDGDVKVSTSVNGPTGVAIINTTQPAKTVQKNKENPPVSISEGTK